MLMLQEVNPMEPNIYLYLERQLMLTPQTLLSPLHTVQALDQQLHPLMSRDDGLWLDSV